MMSLRRKEMFRSQAFLELLLLTSLQHAQKCPSNFLQADSVVRVVSSRLRLLVSVAQYFSSTASLASLAEQQ